MSHHTKLPTAGGLATLLLLSSKPTTGVPSANPWGLTARESEVAYRIAAGHANKQIAFSLAISSHTARRHTERVFLKMGVNCRSQVLLALIAASPVIPLANDPMAASA